MESLQWDFPPKSLLTRGVSDERSQELCKILVSDILCVGLIYCRSRNMPGRDIP